MPVHSLFNSPKKPEFVDLGYQENSLFRAVASAIIDQAHSDKNPKCLETVVASSYFTLLDKDTRNLQLGEKLKAMTLTSAAMLEGINQLANALQALTKDELVAQPEKYLVSFPPSQAELIKASIAALSASLKLFITVREVDAINDIPKKALYLVDDSSVGQKIQLQAQATHYSPLVMHSELCKSAGRISKDAFSPSQPLVFSEAEQCSMQAKILERNHAYEQRFLEAEHNLYGMLNNCFIKTDDLLQAYIENPLEKSDLAPIINARNVVSRASTDSMTALLVDRSAHLIASGAVNENHFYSQLEDNHSVRHSIL